MEWMSATFIAESSNFNNQVTAVSNNVYYIVKGGRGEGNNN